MTHKCDRTKFPFPKVNGESSLKHTWTLMSTLSSFFFGYIKSLFTKENKNQLFQVEGLTLFQRSEIHWWQNKFLAHPPHVRSEETDRNDFGKKKGIEPKTAVFTLDKSYVTEPVRHPHCVLKCWHEVFTKLKTCLIHSTLVDTQTRGKVKDS